MNEIIKGMGFHHIALKCKDFDKSIKFYESLGCVIKAAWSWDEGRSRAAMVDIGDGGCIELFSGGINEKTEIPEMRGEWMHLAFACEDTDAAFNTAIAAGASERNAPYDTEIASVPPIPVRIAFVSGPDGEVIEFFHVRDGE